MSVKKTILDVQTLNESQHHLLKEINQEYLDGLKILNSLGPKTLTVYGGHKIKKDSKTYNQVLEFAEELAKNGWGIASGGGPGVMKAALKGAKQGGGQAVAFCIRIANEPPSGYSDYSYIFDHFSVRKYLLRQSDAYLFTPGGFGTLDELMEVLTLIKVDMLPPRPIYLLDKSFWKGYIDWFEKILLEERGVIYPEYLNTFKVIDDPKEAVLELIGTK